MNEKQSDRDSGGPHQKLGPPGERAKRRLQRDTIEDDHDKGNGSGSDQAEEDSDDHSSSTREQEDTKLAPSCTDMEIHGEETAQAKSSKPKRKRKHPNAPKRCRSAFIIFSQHKHGELRKAIIEGTRQDADGKQLHTMDVARLVSEEWNAMPKSKRKKWEEMAEEDKRRYMQEKDKYTGPWTVQKDTKRHKHPAAPKKPTPAYFAFANERRQRVKDEESSATNAEVSKKLSKMWKQADEETRKHYIEKEKREKIEYFKATEDWKNENPDNSWWAYSEGSVGSRNQKKRNDDGNASSEKKRMTKNEAESATSTSAEDRKLTGEDAIARADTAPRRANPGLNRRNGAIGQTNAFAEQTLGRSTASVRHAVNPGQHVLDLNTPMTIGTVEAPGIDGNEARLNAMAALIEHQLNYPRFVEGTSQAALLGGFQSLPGLQLPAYANLDALTDPSWSVPAFHPLLHPMARNIDLSQGTSGLPDIAGHINGVGSTGLLTQQAASNILAEYGHLLGPQSPEFVGTGRGILNQLALLNQPLVANGIHSVSQRSSNALPSLVRLSQLSGGQAPPSHRQAPSPLTSSSSTFVAQRTQGQASEVDLQGATGNRIGIHETLPRPSNTPSSIVRFSHVLRAQNQSRRQVPSPTPSSSFSNDNVVGQRTQGHTSEVDLQGATWNRIGIHGTSPRPSNAPSSLVRFSEVLRAQNRSQRQAPSPTPSSSLSNDTVVAQRTQGQTSEVDLQGVTGSRKEGQGDRRSKRYR